VWPLLEECKLALACSTMEFLTFREWLRAFHRPLATSNRSAQLAATLEDPSSWLNSGKQFSMNVKMMRFLTLFLSAMTAGGAVGHALSSTMLPAIPVLPGYHSFRHWIIWPIS
jgi:hypothetical protein